MAIYDYKGLSPDGKQAKGIVEAETQKAARLKLKKQGVMVTQIAEKNAAKPQGSNQIPFMSGKVGPKDVALMTRQLASLVKANIPLVDALTAMTEQTENEKLKVVLAQVRQDVNEGSSFSKACKAHPKVFDSIFYNMIEAGESSGTLGAVLLRLADLKEAQMRLRSKVVAGMTYPSLMLVVAVALMLGIFTFVIPKLAKIFESMHKKMPPVTQFLITMSDVIVSWWPLIGLVTFAAFWLFRSWSTSAKGKPKWDAMLLKMPIVGPLIRMIAMTRFSSTMSTMLASKVPILTSMSIARNLIGNIPIANAVSTARENITEGQSIAEPLRRSGEFPPMMIHMIATGEKTGDLAEMFKNISETYEEQVNTRIEGMTSLLEPLMIIMMGLAVAVIVMAVFVPLMDMSNLNQH